MFPTSVKVAVAAVLAAGALAACQPVKMGSAAIVGDDRITTSSLDQTVQDWSKQFKASPDANNERQRLGEQPLQGSELRIDSVSESQMRAALTWLVTLQVSDEVAKEQNIAVTPAQIDQMITALGGERRVAALTLAAGLPVSYSRDLVSFQIVRTTLLQRNGADPQNAQSPQNAQAQARSAAVFLQAAKRLKITVNPRYGVYDPSQIAIGPVQLYLSGAETGTGQQPKPGQPEQPGQPGQPEQPEQQQPQPEQQVPEPEQSPA